MKKITFILFISFFIIETIYSQKHTNNLKGAVLAKIKENNHTVIENFEIEIKRSPENSVSKKTRNPIFNSEEYVTFIFYIYSSPKYNNNAKFSINLKKYLTRDPAKTCNERSYKIVDIASDRHVTMKKIGFKCGGIYECTLSFEENKPGHAIMLLASEKEN